MDNNSARIRAIKTSLKTLLAAELFSKLPASSQDAIIDLIISLLSG